MIRRSQRGFTFIELILALAILAASMTIFVGLQAAAVQRTIHDRNVQQAMLAARRIMAAIETNPTLLDQGNVPLTPLPALFSQFGAPPPADKVELDALQALQATMTVDEWPLPVPTIDQPSMRRLTLTVAWGLDIDERFELVYYVPIG